MGKTTHVNLTMTKNIDIKFPSSNADVRKLEDNNEGNHPSMFIA